MFGVRGRLDVVERAKVSNPLNEKDRTASDPHQLSTLATAPATDFPNTPFFLISSRAAAIFRSDTLEGVPGPFAPKINKVFGAPPVKGSKASEGKGGDASAGITLGEYILGWLRRRKDAAPATTSDSESRCEPPLLAKPILLLQGDKSLPALPSFFEENGLPYKTIVVYETCEEKNLAANLSRLKDVYDGLGWKAKRSPSSRKGSMSPVAIRKELVGIAAAAPQQPQGEIEVIQTDQGRPDWIVFFSPSGVEYASRHLKALGWFPPPGLAAPHCLALGPTTAKHLEETYSLDEAKGDWAVATVPEPKGVKEGIDIWEKRWAGREEAKGIVNESLDDVQGS